jgi:hypothetical protein
LMGRPDPLNIFAIVLIKITTFANMCRASSSV